MIGNALYISAFNTVRCEINKSENREIWQRENRILPISYDNTDCVELKAVVGMGVQYIETYNNILNSYYDGVSHELAHTMNYIISGYTPYMYASGAIQESYADILGNLAEMMRTQTSADYKMGYCDKENWLVGEGTGYGPGWNRDNFVESIFSNYADHMNEYSYQIWLYSRNMRFPEETMNYNGIGSPSYVGEEGIYISNTPEELDIDNAGVHLNSGILNNVCYNMYQKLTQMDENFGYQELYDIWFDSMQYITADTVYSDVATYVKQSMLNKDYSSESIESVMECFNDARVYDYVPNETEHVYVHQEVQLAALPADENVETMDSNVEEEQQAAQATDEAGTLTLSNVEEEQPINQSADEAGTLTLSNAEEEQPINQSADEAGMLTLSNAEEEQPINQSADEAGMLTLSNVEEEQHAVQPADETSSPMVANAEEENQAGQAVDETGMAMVLNPEEVSESSYDNTNPLNTELAETVSEEGTILDAEE